LILRPIMSLAVAVLAFNGTFAIASPLCQDASKGHSAIAQAIQNADAKKLAAEKNLEEKVAQLGVTVPDTLAAEIATRIQKINSLFPEADGINSSIRLKILDLQRALTGMLRDIINHPDNQRLFSRCDGNLRTHNLYEILLNIPGGDLRTHIALTVAMDAKDKDVILPNATLLAQLEIAWAAFEAVNQAARTSHELRQISGDFRNKTVTDLKRYEQGLRADIKEIRNAHVENAKLPAQVNKMIEEIISKASLDLVDWQFHDEVRAVARELGGIWDLDRLWSASTKILRDRTLTKAELRTRLRTLVTEVNEHLLMSNEVFKRLQKLESDLSDIEEILSQIQE
jgi:hypothetical protein